MLRALALCEREARRALFCELLRGVSLRIVATAWGLKSRTVVVYVRDGRLPLTDNRIDRLPPAMRSAFVARFGEPTQLRLPGLLAPSRGPSSFHHQDRGVSMPKYESRAVPLTEHDKERLMSTRKTNEATIGKLVMRRERFNERVKKLSDSAKVEVDKATRCLSQGEQQMDCRVDLDFHHGKARYVREDTGAEVYQRPLTQEERQVVLPIGHAPADAYSKAADGVVVNLSTARDEREAKTKGKGKGKAKDAPVDAPASVDAAPGDPNAVADELGKVIGKTLADLVRADLLAGGNHAEVVARAKQASRLFASLEEAEVSDLCCADGSERWLDVVATELYADQSIADALLTARLKKKSHDDAIAAAAERERLEAEIAKGEPETQTFPLDADEPDDDELNSQRAEGDDDFNSQADDDEQATDDAPASPEDAADAERPAVVARRAFDAALPPKKARKARAAKKGGAA